MVFFFFLTNQGRLALSRNKERLSIDPYFQYHLSQRLDRFEKLSIDIMDEKKKIMKVRISPS